jgi:LPS O-antigen subunit length determinant protein (WzzB/FepE family)
MVNEEEKNVVDSKAGNFEIDKDDEINLYDLWKVVVKRKMIIIAIVLISLLGAAMYCFIAPQIYRVETYVKLYMPKDISTVKELPTGKDISSIIGKIDDEKKAAIFPKTADEITDAKIGEIKGVADKFKITIESRNHENLTTALQEMIMYIENIREIKSNYEKIIMEIDERIKNVKEAEKKSYFQIKELEKRLNSTKVLPVGFDPYEISQKSIELKMEKYRFEQERHNYKLIQLLEDPFISKEPIKPKKAMIIIIAGICSLMFGVFIVFIAEYFERMRRQTQYKQSKKA